VGSCTWDSKGGSLAIMKFEFAPAETIGSGLGISPYIEGMPSLPFMRRIQFCPVFFGVVSCSAESVFLGFRSKGLKGR
jgi:hypothetical protein